GKIKSDDFFGEVATYEKEVVIKLPIAGDYTGETFSITAWGQGCNEPIGVCYPPQSNTIEFNTQLAALQVDTTPAMDSSVDELRGLLGNLNAGQQEFLDVDQAFRLDVSVNDDNDVVFHFNIEPGYYLYQNSLQFEATDDAVSVGRYSLPPGKPKTDEYFGDVIVYYGSFDVRVPVEGEFAELLNMKVTYQGCAEKGICYAPVEKEYQLAMAVPVADEAPTEQIAATDQDASAIDTKETRSVFDFGSYFKDYQFDRAFFGLLLAAFGTGLLLTFTPCVLPMIPIVSSIVVGQGGGKARGGWLS
ncbi:MAG: protein-disulfide reductase DsbD domain-containing protein, partial [Arenicellales bacterium WSBS_2016_MAG_OTU3]